ncbi:MAG TPA: ABC transporter substrate-binding protein [Candidatus Caenarcaniphilales bacterium]
MGGGSILFMAPVSPIAMAKQEKHQTWARRQTLQLIAGAVGGMTLHACTNSTKLSLPFGSSSASDTSASLGITTWVGYAPLYIAQEKGFFRQQGLDLTVQVFSSDTTASAAFAAGRLNGLASVTSEAVLLAATGKDYRVVQVADTSVGGDGILARSSIQDIHDFKGKQIALEEGDVSHFFLLQVLEEAGLQDKDVTLVNMTPQAAAAAYQTGKVEIAVTYSPFLQNANAAQKDGRIIYDTSRMPTAIIDFYIFDPQFIKTSPQAVTAFVAGIFQGLNFLNTHTDEGLAIAAKQLAVTPEELATQLEGVRLPGPRLNAEMLGDPQSDLYLLTSLQELGQFLKDQKQIQAVPDLSQVPEPKFVKQVQATT